MWQGSGLFEVGPHSERFDPKIRLLAGFQRRTLTRARLLLPNSLIVRAYLARSLRLWLGIRVVLLLAGALAASNFARVSAGAIVPIVCLTVVVGFIDTRRRHERALLGNLGIGAVTLAVLFALPPLVAEIAIHALLAR